MWISRERFERLEERLNRVENTAVNASRWPVFYVNKYPSLCGLVMRDESYRLSIKDAVELIMDHLGIEIEYVSGEPEKCIIKPLKPAESTKPKPKRTRKR